MPPARPGARGPRAAGAAPALDDDARRRAAACSASVVSISATTSSRVVSPISTSGVPSATVALADLRTAQHRAGHRRAHARRRAAVAGCPRRSAAARRAPAPARARRRGARRPAASTSLLRRRDGQAVVFELGRRHEALLRQLLAAPQLQLRLLLRDLARVRCARPRARRCACAASTRASSSRSVRSSCIGDSTGVSVATTAPASTASPSRSAMRASRAGQRRRHDVAIEQSRLAVFVDRWSRRPVARARDLDLHRPRRERPGRAGRCTPATEPPDQPLVFSSSCQSLVFNAATMSSLSMRRRTTSALATPAASTHDRRPGVGARAGSTTGK